jgi:hypothetical protein
MEDNVIYDEMKIEEIEEEPIYEKIIGLTAEIDQMERMIEENIRLIAEGDDVEGRIFLKAHLENEVAKKRAEISKLEQQM